MTARPLLRDFVVAHAPLTDIIPEARWVSSGSLREDNAPASPFAAIRWGVVSRGVGLVRVTSVGFWIHDAVGTYQRINNVISLLTGRLDGVEHLSDPEGNELMSISYSDTSGDLQDNGFRTNVRVATFTVVGKGF